MSGEVVGRPSDGGGDGGGKVEAVREVAGRAADRAGEVAGEAQSQVKAVARDAAGEVRGLVDRARRDVDAEAGVRSRQAAGALRSFADQLGALADGDVTAAGSLTGWVRDGQDRLAGLAGRLEDGPSAVLDDVRRFARRQPVLFLASAGLAGFMAGRLLRASREVSTGTTTPSTTGMTTAMTGTTGALPVTTGTARVGAVGEPLPEPQPLVPPVVEPVGLP